MTQNDTQTTPQKKLIALVGANASGKSALGVKLAKKFGGDVISADSRQIYRKLDLGSGKITPDEQENITHKMIDIADPGTLYPLFSYQKDAYSAINATLSNHKRPFLVGGTGLYIDAITQGYQLIDTKPDEKLRLTLQKCDLADLQNQLLALDPKAPDLIDMKNPRRIIRAIEIIRSGHDLTSIRAKRPNYDVLSIGIIWDRDLLRARIQTRLDTRLKQGMIQEVETLLKAGVSYDFFYDLGLEYRFIAQYLNGDFTSYDDFQTKLYFAICQFAKRQYSWFRKDKTIIWHHGDSLDFDRVCDDINRFFA